MLCNGLIAHGLILKDRVGNPAISTLNIKTGIDTKKEKAKNSLITNTINLCIHADGHRNCYSHLTVKPLSSFHSLWPTLISLCYKETLTCLGVLIHEVLIFSCLKLE